MIVLAAVLPLLSTLLGAAITYWINVRQRKQTHLDDLINQAIGAMAAAEASIDYIAAVHRPIYMNDADFAQFQSWLVTENMKRWATNVAEANIALARVSPYRPGIAKQLPFKPDAANRGTHETLIAMLRAE